MSSHVDETSKVPRGEELPKRLFALNHYPIRRIIHAYSKPEYLTSIASALKGTKEMDFLLKSCFGHLFRISPSFSGNLVHAFICRQLVTKKKHEIWMVFGGKPIKFSLSEFGIVTGLPCGKYPENNRVKELIKVEEGSTISQWDSLFGKDGNPRIKKLVEMLHSNVEWDANKKLQVSLIIIVDGILTPKSQFPRPRSKTVEMTKDLEFFCKFPWGRMSYELTYEKISGFIDEGSVQELRSRLKQATISVHGFPLALQLLAFEAVPSLKTLNIIHTSDIMKFEEAKVFVDSIIHCDYPDPCNDSLTWDDEVVDSQVEYIESLIKGGEKFDDDVWLAGWLPGWSEYNFTFIQKGHVWLGGDDSLPMLKLNTNKGRKRKGKEIIEVRRKKGIKTDEESIVDKQENDIELFEEPMELVEDQTVFVQKESVEVEEDTMHDEDLSELPSGSKDGCTQNSGGENIKEDMEAGDMDKSMRIGLRRSPRLHGSSTVPITADSKTETETVASNPRKRKKSVDGLGGQVDKKKIHLNLREDVERVTEQQSRKEVSLFKLLVNSVWEKGQLGEEEEDGEEKLVSSPKEQYEEEDERIYDDERKFLPVRPVQVSQRFGCEDEEPKSSPVLSEWEIEKAGLWEEMELCRRQSDHIGNKLPLDVEKEIPIDDTPAASCKKGNHDLRLDIEIGKKCIHCGFVKIEIRNMDEAEWGNKNTSGRRKTDRFREEGEGSSRFFEELGFDAQNKNSSNGGACVSSNGTVWDLIPGIKSQMYAHQQEGFEFIWMNLAGTVLLNELNNFENSDETGGCVISHAPGTGKTRLTIIFLQAYLECFPDCKPVIIAPASLLLTWEQEFKKWNVSVPFYNLSSFDFNGKENSTAVNLLMQKNSSARSNNEIRMVKIYSWIKAKSILGISYNLYENLAGVKDKKRKTAREVKPDKELDDIREILMGKPGLLVLDEAHTPRNQRSCIWKTLSKVETQKRILLSGTPFQNNFQELCNVLGLARPEYLKRLTSTLKKRGMTVTKRGKRALGDGINNLGIKKLKKVMLPFVHVHKGTILQKSLPGLRECVVVLNPPELQKRVLESIEVTHNQKMKNVFETEHKLSLVSVHPSLVSHCNLSAKERLTFDEAFLADLKKIRLDPNQSVKTRFLMKFIGLCDVVKEKVLVFSQYIDPLKLIMKHLNSHFKWNEGEEMLFMYGKLDQKQRQTLINEFNDPKSKAKVFLASTKACSEGISLVGASRVILLDVVWNPAVERQAISRAYRIGQKRIVYTYHLVAKGTPEGPKYCKQAQKDKMSELVFASSSKHEKGKEKIDGAVKEDKLLDTMKNHMKLEDMFDNIIVQPKEAGLVEGFNVLMP